MKIDHFIAFTAISGNRLVTGNTSVSVEGHIKSMEDIRRIEKELEEKDNKTSQLVILNWRRFE